MKNPTVAALHIQGRRLRYAEIADTAEGPSVVTLGQHVLEADLTPAILGVDGEGAQEGLDRLGEVREALSAKRGRVVVPPSAVYSFFVPLPAEVAPRERRQHVLQQTALVTGMGTVTDLHVASSGVRPAREQDGRPYEWVHVLAFPEEARTRFQAAFELQEEWAWMISSEASVQVPRADGPEASAPFSLLVGEYDTHTEFSLVREAKWHHAQYTEASEHSEDLGYSLRSFLNGLDVSPAAVGELAAYGDPTTSAHRSVVEAELGREATVLNPFASLMGEEEEEDPSAFVPCIGAALHALAD